MSDEAMTGRLSRLPDSYDSRDQNLETLSLACSLLCSNSNRCQVARVSCCVTSLPACP